MSERGECEYYPICPATRTAICYYPLAEKCLLWKLATKVGVDFEKSNNIKG